MTTAKVTREKAAFSLDCQQWQNGIATVASVDHPAVCFDVSAENIEGRSKYSIVGELRYFGGEIRAAANALVKAGKTHGDALAEAVRNTWDKMQSGEYTLRLGDGEGSDITAEQKLAAVLEFFLPNVKLANGTTPSEAQLLAARKTVQAKFDAVTITKKERKAKDGTVTAFDSTSRPAFNEFTARQDVKTFLAKHFESTKTDAALDDVLFS